MTTISLRPYLQLIALGKGSTLARDLAQGLPAEIIEALLRARLLEEGPQPAEFPCDDVTGTCARVIIPYTGPEMYDYRAVPPGRSSCCDTLHLMACEVRTLLVPESGLVRMCSEWLGIDALRPDQLYRAVAVQRLGSVHGPEGRVPVFFARRPGTRQGREKLSELSVQGPSLVLAPLRHGLSLDLQDRFAREGAMHFVFIEDVLAVVDGEVAITAPPPLEAPTSSGVRPLPTREPPVCRLLTLQGTREITQRELDHQRASMSQHDLFVDYTRTAKGGGIRAWVRKEVGSAQVEEILTPLEGKILLEYARKRGRPMDPRKLDCIVVAESRHGMRRFRDLRSKIDVRDGRDKYRIFHSDKGASLKISAYLFNPPDDFSMAILLPLGGDESETDDVRDREGS